MFIPESRVTHESTYNWFLLIFHLRLSAEVFCDSVVQMREDYKVDGIDLDIEDGGTNAEIQTHLLKSCREKLGPDFLIT